MLSGQRLITPLELTTSADAASMGKSSIRPSRNSTLSSPNLTAIDRLRSSISGVMSTPINVLRCPPRAPPRRSPYRLRIRDRQLSHQDPVRPKRKDCPRRQRLRRRNREAGQAASQGSRVEPRGRARYGSDTQRWGPLRPRGTSRAPPCGALPDRQPRVSHPSPSPSACAPDDLALPPSP